MNNSRYPLGPLWVLIGFFWLVSLFEPLVYEGLPRPLDSFRERISFGPIAPGLIHGLALSQFVLLAAWLTLAKSDSQVRLVGTIAVGSLSLLIWLVASWSPWSMNYSRIPDHGEWTLCMLLFAPCMLLLVGVVTYITKRRARWSIAGAFVAESSSSDDARRAMIRSVATGIVLFILGTILLLWEGKFFMAISDFWLEGRWEREIAEAGPVLLGVAITVLSGIPWLAIMVDSQRRWLWRIIAPTVSVLMSLLGMSYNSRGGINLFYPGVQLGQILGIVGSLSLLAACGWRVASTVAATPQDEPPLPFATTRWTAVREYCIRHRVLLVVLGFAFTAILPSAYVLGAALNSYRFDTIFGGVYASLFVLLAVWLTLSTAPIRVRVPGVAFSFLAAFFLWVLSLEMDVSLPEILASPFSMLMLLWVIAILVATCLLLRAIGGFRIVRSVPPTGAAQADAPGEEGSNRGKQFSVRDLFFWTAVVALAITLSKLLLPHFEVTDQDVLAGGLIFTFVAVALMPSLLCVGAVLHEGRRWVWIVICGITLFPGAYLFIHLVWWLMNESSQVWEFWVYIYCFQIGACLGVAGAMTLLATAGYRLEGRWARRQPKSVTENISPVTEETTA